jgi:CubicO group peptidase (beta-lactamase class C family)
MTPRARIAAGLAAEIDACRLPGAVLKVVHRGRVLADLALGRRDPAHDAPMPDDAIFRIYSMTKPLVSVAALMLMEEGRLQLADPVAAWLPAFGAMRVVARDGGTVPALRPIRLHDLLTHSSGLTYGGRSADPAIRAAHAGLPVNPRALTPEDFAARLAAAPLLHQPGTTWEYGFSTDLLGLVLAQATGQSLETLLRTRLLDPLGMADTGFALAEATRLAQPFAADPLGGAAWTLPDQTYDPTEPARMASGGAGALSTAGDYLRFTRMLLSGGTLDGVRILSPASVRLMTADHLGHAIATPISPGEAAMQSPGYGFGLGVAVRLADGLASVPGSAGDYFWSGSAATGFWVDPREDLAAVFMAQTPGAMRLRLRRLLRQLVYQAL